MCMCVFNHVQPGFRQSDDSRNLKTVSAHMKCDYHSFFTSFLENQSSWSAFRATKGHVSGVGRWKCRSKAFHTIRLCCGCLFGCRLRVLASHVTTSTRVQPGRPQHTSLQLPLTHSRDLNVTLRLYPSGEF